MMKNILFDNDYLNIINYLFNIYITSQYNYKIYLYNLFY